MECFSAIGALRGFHLASGSPDTESYGRGSGCPWVGGVFPGWGYRCGWGPPEDAQDRPVSSASPRVLDGMQGCQYRMTSYDQILVVRTSVQHMGYSCTTCGC